MEYRKPFLLNFLVTVMSAAKLVCDDFKTTVDVIPHLEYNSGLLVNWSLMSPDTLCTDPAQRPKFNQVKLDFVSLISICYECPQCSVVLPDAFELPVGSSIRALFIVGKHLPYNRPKTDIPIHYLITNRAIPPVLRNCEVIVRNQYARDNPITGEEALSVTNITLYAIVFATVIMFVCCIRCTCIRITSHQLPCDARSLTTTQTV